jgi:hypothetical protein
MTAHVYHFKQFRDFLLPCRQAGDFSTFALTFDLTQRDLVLPYKRVDHVNSAAAFRFSVDVHYFPRRKTKNIGLSGQEHLLTA